MKLKTITIKIKKKKQKKKEKKDQGRSGHFIARVKSRKANAWAGAYDRRAWTGDAGKDGAVNNRILRSRGN